VRQQLFVPPHAAPAATHSEPLELPEVPEVPELLPGSTPLVPLVPLVPLLPPRASPSAAASGPPLL
jgi:hypothetical protein